MGLFDFFKPKEQATALPGEPVGNASLSTAEVVEELEKLGYFKYADKKDVAGLKKEVSDGLQEGQYLSTLWNEERPYNSKDFRHYDLDHETLFEQDGFADYLKDFDHLFAIIGLELNITNHAEEWDDINRWLNHSLTINGKSYVIFKNFIGYGWGEAAQKFAEILNDQLAIQHKDERIYLARNGNDGSAIVLTQKQFNLLDPLLKDPMDRPLKITDWSRVMQVKNNPL